MNLNLLAVTFVTLATLSHCHEQFKVTFQWNSIEVVWPSEDVKERAIEKKEYIPEANALAGIKVWKGKMYLTVPRWKPGVPVTLGVASADPTNGTHPLLEAFPNWKMQTIGDCRAFQFVQSMEIDPMGRMWVLDTGRIDTQTLQPKNHCPPRLVILDLENEGKVLKIHEFPEDVTPRDSSYLNDIVLDHEDGGIAYISDNGKADPGIIVYSLRNDSSWKVRHPSMKSEGEAVTFVVNGTHIVTPIDVDGIALSPASDTEDRRLFYTPLSSFHIYSIPTSELKDPGTTRYSFKEHGKKNSQTDGMAMSATGVLYFGLLADDAVAIWDTKHSSSLSTGQRIIARDHTLMQWPDTFGFDEEGNLWCVTNRLQNFINNRVDVKRANYRVLKVRVGNKGYQYFENGTAPELPMIAGGSASVTGFALSTTLLVVLTLICLPQ